MSDQQASNVVQSTENPNKDTDMTDTDAQKSTEQVSPPESATPSDVGQEPHPPVKETSEMVPENPEQAQKVEEVSEKTNQEPNPVQEDEASEMVSENPEQTQKVEEVSEKTDQEPNTPVSKDEASEIVSENPEPTKKVEEVSEKTDKEPNLPASEAVQENPEPAQKAEEETCDQQPNDAKESNDENDCTAENSEEIQTKEEYLPFPRRWEGEEAPHLFKVFFTTSIIGLVLHTVFKYLSDGHPYYLYAQSLAAMVFPMADGPEKQILFIGVRFAQYRMMHPFPTSTFVREMFMFISVDWFMYFVYGLYITFLNFMYPEIVENVKLME